MNEFSIIHDKGTFGALMPFLKEKHRCPLIRGQGGVNVAVVSPGLGRKSRYGKKTDNWPDSEIAEGLILNFVRRTNHTTLTVEFNDDV